jgi:hypothetical protein
LRSTFRIETVSGGKMGLKNQNAKMNWLVALMISVTLSLWGHSAEARRHPSSYPPPAPAPAPVPAGVTTTQVLKLSNSNLSVQPGQTLNFTTNFNAVPLDKDYAVFVHFVNLLGQNALGADYSPSPGTSQWSGLITANRSITVPSNLAAGIYSVRIGLYELVYPYTNRVQMDAGPGVVEDSQTQYTVGSLTVGSAAPSPAPTPGPSPSPTPVPAPVPQNPSSYTLSLTTPASGAKVSGKIQVTGSGPGFLNVEVLTSSGTLLARSTPSSTGAFSATVDTTQLPNGTQTVTIDGWDSPAGQTFTHTAEMQLTLNVQNAGGTTTPSTVPSGVGTGGSSVPVGGPGGYSNMKMNDSFGSSKTGANITSLSQFNSGSYGANGSGWDDHMCAWDCNKANLSMSSDHLEIYPTTGGSGFISSRFEYLPTGSQRVYYEIRAATGRGDQGGQTWPAFWFFAGNEPGSNNAQSEFDLMETYMSQQWGPYDSAAGGWAQHFVVTSHPNANSTLDSYSISTTGIDITITYNVYGCEVYRGSDGNLHYNIYFNGQLQKSPTQGMPWNSTSPSLFLGWNPGSTTWSPATMKIDYVKAWIK